MSPDVSTSPKFYGYRVQVYVMMLATATLGFGYLTLGLYVPMLVIEMEASLTSITVLFSVVGCVSMFFSFFSGAVSRLIGFKRMIWIGVIALLSGYIVLYFATNLAMLYLAGAFIGAALSWAGVVMIARTVTAWFTAKRGLMLGFASASAGIGALIGSPIISGIIATTGRKNATLVTLVIMALLTIPAATLIKAQPSDIGQEPLGEGATASSVPNGKFDHAISGIRGRTKLIVSLLLLVVFFAGCFSASGVYPNIANAMVQKGFDITFAGSLLAVVALCGIIGNIIVGVLGDRLGIRAVLVYVLGVGALSLILLASGSSIPVAFVFAILFGLNQPITGPLVTMLTLRVFGPADFPTMIGRNDASLNLFTIITPFFIGVLFDSTGSYDLPLFIGASIFVAGIVAGLVAISLSEKQQAEAEGTNEESKQEIIREPQIP